MGRVAAGMEAVGMNPHYPKIPFKPHEIEREKRLKVLAQKFQQLMDDTRNNTALKGGTALRFTLGLPRPSTDLDFEGDKAINVRRAVRKAVDLAFGKDEYKVGWNWLFRGTVQIREIQRRTESGNVKIDYRRMGTFPDMPPKVPINETDVFEGIRIYNGEALVHRKLGSRAGVRPVPLWECDHLTQPGCRLRRRGAVPTVTVRRPAAAPRRS